MKRTKQQLEEMIKEITQEIKQTESHYPGKYGTSEWWIHHTLVRDLYWRRRMLITELEGGDKNETAKVY